MIYLFDIEIPGVLIGSYWYNINNGKIYYKRKFGNDLFLYMKHSCSTPIFHHNFRFPPIDEKKLKIIKSNKTPSWKAKNIVNIQIERHLTLVLLHDISYY